MALARVVTFEGVNNDRMAELQREIGEGERPDDIPATEIIVLHDPEGEKSEVILFFDSEEDYQRGHATLDAMPGDNTPGQRTSVSKYNVAVRRTD
jgi:hypothetical protein